MKSFEYGDEEIGYREILLAVPSMVIGVGILTLPRSLADVTEASDGWVSIVMGGAVALLFVWIVSKLASRFPRQNFLEYTTQLVSRPVAILLSFLLSFHLLQFTAHEMRAVAIIAKFYLFDRTPVEVIALIFLLVVVYGVSGSRAGLLRLNLLFLPIVLLIAIIVLLMNTGYFQIGNLMPVFTTPWTAYLKGAKESVFSFFGFEILLFYIALMNRPKKAPQAALIGMSIPLVLYLLIYTVVIAVFGKNSALQMTYPVVEIAKEIEVPGEFFERFESIFFTIWVMTLFNTAVMAYDASILSISSIFPKVKKIYLIFILTPLIYLSGMLPPTLMKVFEVAQWISYSSMIFAMAIPVLLLVIAKVRGIKGSV